MGKICVKEINQRLLLGPRKKKKNEKGREERQKSSQTLGS